MNRESARFNKSGARDGKSVFISTSGRIARHGFSGTPARSPCAILRMITELVMIVEAVVVVVTTAVAVTGSL